MTISGGNDNFNPTQTALRMGRLLQRSAYTLHNFQQWVFLLKIDAAVMVHHHLCDESIYLCNGKMAVGVAIKHTLQDKTVGLWFDEAIRHMLPF